MLTVKTPLTYKPERKYITQVLLGDFLGIDYHIQFQDRQHVSIGDKNGKELILPDVLFQTPQNQWLTTNSLPKQPLSVWDTDKANLNCTLINPKIPIIYGQSPFDFPKRNFLPIDIFGSAFFMLTRYEEVVKPDRDEYDRFPATESLAYQEAFLDRPIINEYLEILWFYLKRLWPGITRKKRLFRIFPTHDVDIPYDYLLRPFWKIVLRVGADLFRRKDPILGIKNFSNWLKVNITGRNDPFDTFDWIMNQSEKAGLKSSFNFMTCVNTQFDYNYPLNDQNIQHLINRILSRGHEVGFHPSYSTALDDEIWTDEYLRLKTSFQEYKVKGGRQHILHFRVPLTWLFWMENGLEYDSTLAFADRAGFRCGICYEYRPFDLEKRKVMSLFERPLIVMERTVIDERYMGFGRTKKAINYMIRLKKICQTCQGDFVFLWHNQRFVNSKEREMYKTLLDLN